MEVGQPAHLTIPLVPVAELHECVVVFAPARCDDLMALLLMLGDLVPHQHDPAGHAYVLGIAPVVVTVKVLGE